MTRPDPRRSRSNERQSRPLLVGAVALAAAGISGCASKGPTLGDEIESAGAEYADIADDWEDGEAKAEKGRKLLRRGRERVRDGEDDIEEGEELVREGEREMEQSKRDYERLRARSPVGVGTAPGS